MFIDSHAHLDGPEYDADRDEVIARALAAGIKRILNVGTGDPYSGSLERAVALAARYDCVYVAAGVHPHDAKHYGEAVEARLEKLLREEPKALAWGEIGLDFHYSHSPAEVQKAVFERQLRAAKKLRLPVIIHSREADTETLEILREVYGKTERGGIMHCFGGGPELARGVLELNFMISFAGNVTFKKAENLREVARMVPLERLLIETDCPYLTPAPYRGLRNEPARVLEVARCLAESRHIGAEELGAVTGANFERFFGLAG